MTELKGPRSGERVGNTAAKALIGRAERIKKQATDSKPASENNNSHRYDLGMIADSKSSSIRIKARNRFFFTWVVIGYILLQVGLFAAMHGARGWAKKNFSGPIAQAEWGEWVEEARRQAAGNGPVQRRVPKSKEPPVLVLMRDYFRVCVFGVWLFSSALFVTFTYLGCGLFGRRSVE